MEIPLAVSDETRNAARNSVLGDAGRKAVEAAGSSEALRQVYLLVDLFGSLPFRPLLPIEASVLAWNDGLVVRMANAIYDDRLLPSGHFAPDRLAVLADALTDAGCTDAELLERL